MLHLANKVAGVTVSGTDGEIGTVEDFYFEETMREIHVELTDLNKDAAELAAEITKNFEGLGI